MVPRFQQHDAEAFVWRWDDERTRVREQRAANIISHVAQRPDAGVIRNHQRGWSREDQRRVAAAVNVFLEVLEQRGAPLVAVDAPEIEDEFSRNAEALEHITRRTRRALRLEADADDLRRAERPPCPG